ncbi:hypothetical protein M0804_006727 [Polistes exclamans]|nr:hypothetical protein M0804_006727 [Polistes exclamans]
MQACMQESRLAGRQDRRGQGKLDHAGKQASTGKEPSLLKAGTGYSGSKQVASVSRPTALATNRHAMVPLSTDLTFTCRHIQSNLEQ